MEKYLSDDTLKSITDLTNFIKSTTEYIECIKLKKEISNDKELMLLIDEVRKCQQNYIKSNYSNEMKKKLDKKLEQLNESSLYLSYIFYLEKVNNMIKLIKEEMNEYFFNVTNILN